MILSAPITDECFDRQAVKDDYPILPIREFRPESKNQLYHS